MAQYILALDQGTTSSRAILFDRRGRLCGSAAQAFPQHFPRPGWVEHDPVDLWRSQLAVARAVLRENGVAARQLLAIGVANQRETTLLWERSTGAPVGPAIVWQDRRGAALCQRLRDAGHAARVAERTGLELDPYFSASKLRWLLDHAPGARDQARRGALAFGTVDSWLAWQLCGAHVTDVGNAARTMLFNIHLLRWDQDMLDLFEIPAAVLPQVVSSSEEVGLARAEWLGAPVPLASLAGDQQAATFGQACLRPGMVKNTYGTGCFMLMQAGRRPPVSRQRLLATVGWRVDGATDYLLEGSVFAAGATLQWLRDGLGILGAAEDSAALAASVPDSGGVTLVPAFAGLGAPHWQPHARAALLGLSRGSGRAHIVRAALEAIAFQSADLLAAMRADGAPPVAELRVDGGAARNDWLMQFQADVLGLPVLRPCVTETTAFGAACLAGLALGCWAGPDETAALWRCERRFEPGRPAHWRAARLARWADAVARVRDDAAARQAAPEAL